MPYPCPAKLNLFLAVTGLLPGGYHGLASVMQKAGLGDELEIEPAEKELSLRCDICPTADPKDNLAYKAAALLKEKAGRPELGARMLLKKRVPPGSGLGGGSSDAATALLALNEIWELGFSVSQLAALALQLGSDVPFFLGGAAAFCTGRGEIMQPLEPRCLYLAIIRPPAGVSTPAVYRQYDAAKRSASQAKDFLAAYREGDWQAIGKALGNDLEAPALELEPKIGEALGFLSEFTPYVRMTGSGSAVFGLFKGLKEAAEAASKIGQSHPDYFAAATQTLLQ